MPSDVRKVCDLPSWPSQIQRATPSLGRSPKSLALIRKAELYRTSGGKATPLTKKLLNPLSYLDQVSTGVAHIKSRLARYRLIIGNDLNSRSAQALFGGEHIRNGVTNMPQISLAIAGLRSNRKMELHAAELIPRTATPSRLDRLRYFFQAQHRTIEVLRGLLKRSRYNDVHMIDFDDANSHSFFPDRQHLLLALGPRLADKVNNGLQLLLLVGDSRFLCQIRIELRRTIARNSQ